MTENINIVAAFSETYEDRFKQEYEIMISSGCSHQEGLDATGITVRCARAKCRQEDKRMLVGELLKHGTLDQVDETTTSVRVNLVKHLILHAAGLVAMGGKPKALLDLVRQKELVAVDWLHEVAAAGDAQAQDALCDCLRPIEPQKNVVVSRLTIALLQTMANRQHDKSFERLAKIGLAAPPLGKVWHHFDFNQEWSEDQR